MGILFKSDDEVAQEIAAERAKKQKESAAGGSSATSDSLRDKMRRAFLRDDDTLKAEKAGASRAGPQGPGGAKEHTEEMHLAEYDGFKLGQKVFVESDPKGSGKYEADWKISEIIYQRSQDRVVFKVVNQATGNSKKATINALRRWQKEGPAQRQSTDNLHEYEGFKVGQMVFAERSPQGSGNYEPGWRIEKILYNRAHNAYVFVLYNEEIGGEKRPSYSTLVDWQREGARRHRPGGAPNIQHPAEHNGFRTLEEVTIEKGPAGSRKYTTRGWIITDIAFNRSTGECWFTVRNNVLVDEKRVKYSDLAKWQRDAQGQIHNARDVNEYQGLRIGQRVIAPTGRNGDLDTGWHIERIISNSSIDSCDIDLTHTSGNRALVSFENLKKWQDDYQKDVQDFFAGPGGTLADLTQLETLGVKRIDALQTRYEKSLSFAKKLLGMQGVQPHQMTLQAIKKVYQKLLPKYHPDQHGSTPVANAFLKVLQAAKALLDDNAVDRK